MRVFIRYSGDASVQDSIEPMAQTQPLQAIKNKFTMKEYFELIKTLIPTDTAVNKPEGGFHYLYESSNVDQLEGKAIK